MASPKKHWQMRQAQRRACDLEADRGRVKKAAQILDDKCDVAQ